MTTSRGPDTLASATIGRSKNGRANASTISRIAARRMASSGQSRIRRRRTDWYGIFSRNISDGNSTTCLRSRCVRWIRIGMANVRSAAKKSGARNAIYLTRLSRWRADRYLNNA